MCECHQPQAVAPAGLSCICHMAWHARASSVYMCKSQILLLGMSQASLDTPLRWQCQGPSWRLPPERHRAGGCRAGERLERARTALCLLSIPPGAICSTEGTGDWTALPRSSPWLSSTGSASFPSTPQARHGSAWGGQTLSKPPATSRGSSMGGMARLLLRNPHVCKALGCWGVSWGASSQERGIPWIWDPQGQRLELEEEASPLPICTLPGDAELPPDLWGGEMGASCMPLPSLCTVATGSLPYPEGPQLSQSEHPRRQEKPQNTPTTSSSPFPYIAPSPRFLLPFSTYPRVRKALL